MESSPEALITVNNDLQKECQELEKSNTYLTLPSFDKVLKVNTSHQPGSHTARVLKRRKIENKYGLFLPRIPILKNEASQASFLLRKQLV
jgi:hypothetical protein